MAHKNFNALTAQITNEQFKDYVTFLTNPNTIANFIGYYTGTVAPVYFRASITALTINSPHAEIIRTVLNAQAPDSEPPAADNYLVKFFYDLPESDHYEGDPAMADVDFAVSTLCQSIITIIETINFK